MATQFHIRTSDSMPERLDVTEQVEKLKRQQAEADQKARLEISKPLAKSAAGR